MELDLATENDPMTVTPLTGGVASDIARVDLPDRTLCVKFALPKLKVAADWQVPVHRNAAEYAWLAQAARIAPTSSVALFGRSERLGGFAMEHLDPQTSYLWKARLLKEGPGAGEAARVGDLLGRLHAASTQPGFDTGPFQNQKDFHALRTDPYLGQIQRMYPELEPHLGPLEEMLGQSAQVLIHGDVSPKNILFRGADPILLDAECATMGEASFDPAFCLNHLVIKAVHMPCHRDALLAQARAFWRAYLGHVTWESKDALESRLCLLLPPLMLARVDGKSPVEYLAPDVQALVRRLALRLIPNPVARLDTLLETIAQTLKDPQDG
ncbi:MAG: aminoglycoside phosphotransferase family protein [Pseudomonadota bacterium]